ncbi:MAG: T9SS type A sorting domain-containing protein [Bacteroidetes bacterium]|nr:T9SS type A sorting domain-containing protein [Bacteroidota bacterium]
MKFAYIVILMLLNSTVLFGQSAGTLDITFDSDGLLLSNPGSIEDRGVAIATQPDGKIVVAGNSALANDRRSIVSRFLPDGSIDLSFGVNGHRILNMQPGVNDFFNSVLIQPDGKILLSGPSGSGIIFRTNVARLLANGALDTGFGINGMKTYIFSGGSCIPYAMKLDASGRILIGGNESNNLFVLRLLADGNVDSTFSGDGIAVDLPPGIFALAFGMCIDNVGRIITVGYSFSPFSYMIARYDSAGALDTTFGQGGVTLIPKSGFIGLYDCKVQPDGKIVACGNFDDTGGGSNHDFVILRLNDNGTPDSTFAGDGVLEVPVSNDRDILQSIILQPDGKIMVAGYVGNNTVAGDFALLRLNSDGIFDTSFGSNGLVLTDFGSSMDIGSMVVLQPDLKVVLCGWSLQNNKWNMAIARYHTGLFTNANDIDFKTDEFRLFPSPANNEIWIEWDKLTQPLEFVSIFDVYGKLAKIFYTPYNNLYQKSVSVYIGDLSSGIYYIKLNKQQGLGTKFVKIDQ